MANPLLWGAAAAALNFIPHVVVKVFCDHFESLAEFGEFLSGNNFTIEPVSGTDTQPAEK